MTTVEIMDKCYNIIRSKTDFVPAVAIVLGSGLGKHATDIDIVETINYSDIEGFPVSTVKGHAGRFVFGYIEQVPVVLMQGRVHYYEGYSMEEVVLPIRLLRMMGAKTLLLTNAAGGIKPKFKAGDFMLIRDHIASFVPNPLLGKNIEKLGERFPDMSNVYDNTLCDIIKNTAADLEIPLHEGVYIQFTGPSYETPTEVHMARLLGADAVGMSTACEAIAAKHAGMKICAISCISNPASGVSDSELSHAEVIEATDKSSLNFKKLVFEIVKNIS